MKSLLLIDADKITNIKLVLDGSTPSCECFDRIYYFKKVDFAPDEWSVFFNSDGMEGTAFQLVACKDTYSELDLCEKHSRWDLMQESDIAAAFQFVSYEFYVCRGDFKIFDGEVLIKTFEFSEQRDEENIVKFIQDYYPAAKGSEFDICFIQDGSKCVAPVNWENRQGQKEIRHRDSDQVVAKFWFHFT